MTDIVARIARATERRFGKAVEVPAGTAGRDALAAMLEHRSHRRFTARAVRDDLLQLLFCGIVHRIHHLGTIDGNRHNAILMDNIDRH